MKRILSFVLLAFAMSASAQEQTLTLKDAVKYALENKSDAKKARLDVENSDHQIREVRAGALPTISANGNLSYNAILQKSALPGEFFGGSPGSVVMVPFGREWVATGGVSLQQALFDMSVFTGLKAAKSTREFYLINANLTDEGVIEKVASMYYQVLVAQEQLAVADSNLVMTKKIRDVIKGQYDNGLAKKVDLDRMSVNVVNMETRRIQSLNNVAIQISGLKFLMGMPLDTPIALAKSEVEVKPISTSEALNVENRTEFQLLAKQEELLRFQKKAEQAGFYPKLSLSANMNYQGLGDAFPLFQTAADGVYWTNYSTIGLNLSVPIFNGFRTKARVDKADVALRRHQEDINDTKLGLQKQYQDAITQINNNEALLNSQRENAKLAQEVLDNTRNNYINGLASLTDLLDSENALTSAQNNYNTALLNYKLAEIQLIKSKGELKNLAQ